MYQTITNTITIIPKHYLVDWDPGARTLISVIHLLDTGYKLGMIFLTDHCLCCFFHSQLNIHSKHKNAQIISGFLN